ncbi:odorant receptor 2a-like [Arctopsyche grandis]|uniref:odorant receptor 2a-like n=1 Tax=Arctopsyche grandis TaxID=121162 RepID=UPI00406D6974
MNGLYGTQLGLQPLYTGAVIIASTLLYDGSQKSNVFLQISFDHIIELFIYCYIGDLVSVKSLALCQRLYSCNWMDMNSSYKKTLLQIMHRCQKPFNLNAGIFGPLTMEMYSKSMQITYSMWTVFKGRAALPNR